VIRRVFLALRAESLKLRRRAIGWASLGAAVLAVLLSQGIGGVAERAQRLSAGERAVAAATTNGFLAFTDGLKAGVFAGSLLLVIFAGLLLAEETELGTAKIVFSKPLRRVEVVLAKWGLLFLLSTALVLVSAVASGLVASALHGLGDVIERDAKGARIYTYHTAEDMYRHVLVALPQIVPPLFAALSLAFLMSALADQSGIAVGLSFGLLLTASVISFLFDRVAPYLVTTYFAFATDTLGAFAAGEATATWWAKWPKGPPKMVLGVAVSLATAAAAWGGAALAVSRRRILFWITGIGLAIGASAGAPEAGAQENAVRFQTCSATMTGQIWDVTIADLDQDGRKDLTVFHVTGRRGSDPKRFLSVFYGRSEAESKGAFYPKTPDQTFEVPNEAVARALADFDPARTGLEVGFVGVQGLLVVPFEKRRADLKKAVRAVPGPCFFDVAPGTQLLDWSGLAQDLDGDGRADLFLPQKGRYDLYVQGPKGVQKRSGDLGAEFNQRFGTRAESIFLNRFINYWAGLSKPAVQDLDGDKRKDVVMFRDGALEVFIGRDPAKGAALPIDPDRRMPLKILAEGTGEEDGFNSVNADFEDVDKDGLTDLILYRNVGKVGLFESLRTQIMLHRARKGAAAKDAPPGTPAGVVWEENPDQIVNLKGMSMNPALMDVDKDGDKDLVLSSLRTDLVTNAKRALFNSVQVTYYVFRFDAEKKRFSDVPDFERDLSIDVARIEGGGTIPLAIFTGDYDGDGYPDLLSIEEPERVRIFPGVLDKGFFGGETLTFDDGREQSVAIETSNSVRIDDLNGDGKSDILFWYWDKSWESVERGAFGVAVSK